MVSAELRNSSELLGTPRNSELRHAFTTREKML